MKYSKKQLVDAIYDYQCQIRFMTSKGWLQENWIKEYGTTEDPMMGDGGERIWEADCVCFLKARRYFLNVYQSCFPNTRNSGISSRDQVTADATRLLHYKAPAEVETYIGTVKCEE